MVVYKTDRFARNKYDSAIYKRQLKKNGIQIYYAAEAIPDGPEGIILESLMEGLAEYYSAELSQKIKRGMNESALKCHSTGAGRPLGYKVAEDKTFAVDPEGAKAVQTIFDMYIKGETCAAICEYLNGIGARTSQNRPFGKNSLNRIIKNEKYLGRFKYGEVVIEGGMPQIISKSIFDLAQREMEKRRTSKQARAPKAEYLLAGKLFCGHCKKSMVGVSGTGKSGNKWYYYYCQTARAKAGCTKKHVTRDWLEDYLVEKTVEHVLQPEVIKDLARKVYLRQLDDDTRKTDIKYYEKRLADNKRSIANILTAIESGAGTKSLPERLLSLESEQDAITGELAYLRTTKLDIPEDEIEFLIYQYVQPVDDWPTYKKRIINCFISEVFLWDDRLLLYYNIKRGETLDSTELSLIESEGFDERLSCSTICTAGRTPDSTIFVLPHGFVLALRFSRP